MYTQMSNTSYLNPKTQQILLLHFLIKLHHYNKYEY